MLKLNLDHNQHPQLDSQNFQVLALPALLLLVFAAVRRWRKNSKLFREPKERHGDRHLIRDRGYFSKSMLQSAAVLFYRRTLLNRAMASEVPQCCMQKTSAVSLVRMSSSTIPVGCCDLGPNRGSVAGSNIDVYGLPTKPRNKTLGMAIKQFTARS